MMGRLAILAVRAAAAASATAAAAADPSSPLHGDVVFAFADGTDAALLCRSRCSLKERDKVAMDAGLEHDVGAAAATDPARLPRHRL